MDNIIIIIKKAFEKQKKDKIGVLIVIILLLILSSVLSKIKENYFEETLNNAYDTYNEKQDNNKNESEVPNTTFVDDIENQIQQFKQIDKIEGKDLIPNRTDSIDEIEGNELDTIVDEKDK